METRGKRKRGNKTDSVESFIEPIVQCDQDDKEGHLVLKKDAYLDSTCTTQFYTFYN